MAWAVMGRGAQTRCGQCRGGAELVGRVRQRAPAVRPGTNNLVALCGLCGLLREVREGSTTLPWLGTVSNPGTGMPCQAPACHARHRA